MKRLLATTPAILALVLSAPLYAQQPALDATPQAAISEAPASPEALAPGDSRIRIVRLSEIRGSVQLARNAGSGFEPTMQNMPIVEGSRLKTSEGFAEVEFEDGSALRLAPNTLVTFPRLILHASGVRASTVALGHGTAYVALSSNKASELTVNVAGRDLIIAPSSHLRIQTEPDRTEIAVMNGSARIDDPVAAIQINKHQTLELTAKDAQPVLAKNVAERPYDEWDKQSFDYQKTYTARGNAFAGSPYQYGLADLNYYGSFANFGGCGTMWRPYLASAAWDPYGNGLWASYAGTGYSWVSPYPWGWTPYHYGSWSYCPGAGWGWQPGGNWRNLNNVPAGVVQNQKLAGGTPVTGPHPPSPPTGTGAGLVMANRTPIVMSTLKSSDSFEFTKNSAGLGVPRGTLGDLGRISNHVEAHGSMARPVYAVPTSNAAFAGPHAQTSFTGPVSLRQGQAPSAFSHADSPFSASHSSSSSPSSGFTPMSTSSAPAAPASSSSSAAHK